MKKNILTTELLGYPWVTKVVFHFASQYTFLKTVQHKATATSGDSHSSILRAILNFSYTFFLFFFSTPLRVLWPSIVSSFLYFVDIHMVLVELNYIPKTQQGVMKIIGFYLETQH